MKKSSPIQRKWLIRTGIKLLFLTLYLMSFNYFVFSQTFTEQTSIQLTGVMNSSLAWGDYNNDGYLDFILTGRTGTDPIFYPITKLYKNNGNNTFTEQTNISLTQVQNGSVAWGDYDGDGYLDILLTGETSIGSISKIYHNNGDNTFTEQSGIHLPGVGYGSATWADYDNDGDLDILIAGNSNSGVISRIYRNDSNIFFTEQAGISLTGVSSGSVAWGDYDNNSYPDILLTGMDSDSKPVSKIYHNNGNNTFSEQSTISIINVGNSSVDWGDFNNDGYLDILLTGNDSNWNNISKIYRNIGNNTFLEQTEISLTAINASSVAWGDCDNDGLLDILLSGQNWPNAITKIYHNNGNNNFTEQTAPSLTGTIEGSVAWGDYDNDSDLDILLTGSNDAKIYRNESVKANTKPSMPGNLQTAVNNGIVTFTWDKATDNETASAGLSYNLYVYESGQINYLSPPQAFRQSDALNGKRLIAKIGNIQCSANGYVLKDLPPDKTYYWTVQAIDAGLMGGNFATEKSFTVPLYKPIQQATNISFSSIQDSQAFINWSNGGGSKRAVFIKQPTSGTADPVDNTTYFINSITPGGWRCVYNGTSNTTNFNDLIINTDYIVHVVEYNGNPGSEKYLTNADFKNPVTFNTQFTEQANISLPGVSGGSVSWGDYNNDNYLDILINGGTNYIGIISKIYLNNGNNSFTEQSGISLTGVGGSLVWGDYNNDNNLDILLAGDYWNYNERIFNSKIYKNNPNHTFTEQTNISLINLRGDCSVAWSDYDNDGYQDILLTGSNGSANVSKIYKNNGDNTFIDQTGIILPGIYYGSVAWGDYDNDGNKDILLTGNSTSGLISKIYRNNGDNSFTEQTGISLPGVGGSSVAWGDYDNDGFLDFILSGTNWIKPITKIYHNNGNNTFTEQTGISLTATYDGAVVWGDFNNDGNLDLLISGNSATGPVTKIYRNNGDKSFTELSDYYLTGSMWAASSFGDYDNDGDLDIVFTGELADGTDISKIYRNNSVIVNKNPEAPKNLSYSFEKNNVRLNWNRVNTDETSGKSITYNIGIGSKSGTTNLLSPQSASNGFRRTVAMGNNQLDTTYLIRNLRWDTTYFASVQAIDNSYKGGAFSNEVQFKMTPVQASQLTASHINENSLLLKWKRGNGDRCVIFAREGATGNVNPINYTTYYHNSQFAESPPLGASGWYCIYKGTEDSVLFTGLDQQKSYSITVIEFQNKNGSEIYAPTFSSENTGVFSSGFFTEQSSISIPKVHFSSAAWADYNNDGFLDFIITGEPINNSNFNPISKIYLNNGDNTFTEQTSISLPGICFSSVAWGDYDNDGYQDILLVGMTSSGYLSKIFKNNGNNSFTEQTTISLTGTNVSSVAWGDYDNDDDLDIILTGQSWDGKNGNPTTIIYRNDGSNKFTAQDEISLVDVEWSSISWADCDNDGDLDFLIPGYTDAGPITKLYVNKGNNSFIEQTGTSFTNTGMSSTAWGDYDNDRNLDLLLTGADWQNICVSKIYHNNGDNSFSEQTNISLSGINWGSATWGDYNDDGYLDILLAGAQSRSSNNPTSKIYKNNGNNTFSDQTDILLTGVYTGTVTWGDYDNDGDLDILMNGLDLNNNSISKIYRNNLIMAAGNFKPNTKPAAPNGLSSSISPGKVDFSWSPLTNDETPSKTMSYNFRYKLKDATHWNSAPHAADDGYRRVPAMGNAQLINKYTLKNISPGTYDWQVQAVDQGFKGGSWSEQQSFTVPEIIADFIADTVCMGNETKFTDLSLGLGEPITSWKWNFGDGNTSETQNPGYIFSAAKSYQVKLIIRSTSYSDSIIKTVEVKPGPIASFDIEKKGALVCQFINNTNEQKVSSWLWNFGDGSTSDLQDPPLYAYSADGIYQVSLKVQTENGCKDSISEVNTVCSTGLEQPEIYVRGPNVWYFAASNDSVSNYRWYRNDQLIANADLYIYVANQQVGTYYVEINNGGACWIPSEKVTIPDDFYNGHAKKMAKNSDIQSNETSILFFPNPGKGKFNLLFDNEYTGKLKINIKDLSGKTLRQYYADKIESFYLEEMDLSKYGKGVYFIEMLYKDKKETVKVVLE